MLYWYLRMALLLYITTLLPLGAKPYLCVSHEILVTPGTRKSKGSVSNPACT